MFNPENADVCPPEKPQFFVTVEVTKLKTIDLEQSKPDLAVTIVPMPWVCLDVKEAIWTSEPLTLKSDPDDPGKHLLDLSEEEDVKYLLENYWPKRDFEPYEFVKALGPSEKIKKPY